MNKIRKTLVVVFSALFVLCMALFAVGCNEADKTADGDAPANSYSVSVDVNDASLGDYTITEADENGGYAKGSSVTVTVTPKADYEAEVYVNGEAVELENGAASFSVDSDTTVQVKYTYKLAANASVISGQGTVTLSSPADGSKYASGETVTVTATPAEGYALKSLTVNGTELTAAQNDDGAYVATFSITEKSYVFADFVALRTVTIDNDGTKGAADVKLADGTPLQSGDTVAEGTELTLTLTPLNGNTVNSVYIAGALTAPKDGKVTFTVKGDTEVKVVYDTYYNVIIPEEQEGGTVELSEKKVNRYGYLENTTLTLTVKADDGYDLTITKVMGGEEEPVELLNDKYTFKVTGEIEFRITFTKATYYIEPQVNNTKYGTVALDSEDGYAYNATATLTVTPTPGYEVEYVSVNGVKIDANASAEGEPLTYSFTVKGEDQVFVCFIPTERYTVTLELVQLFALYKGDALAALRGAITLNGETATANDTFISLECYKGQEVTLEVTAAPLKGYQFFYYVNGAAERTLYSEAYTFEVEGECTIRLTAEQPAKPTVTLGAAKGAEALDQATSAELLGDYAVTPTIVGNYYTFTLGELQNKLVGPTAYLFESWTVKNGENTLEPEEGIYSILYTNNASDMALTITANWVVGHQVPDATMTITKTDGTTTTPIATVETTIDADSVVGTIEVGDNVVRYAEEGATVTMVVTPADNHRLTQIGYTADRPYTVSVTTLGKYEIKYPNLADDFINVQVNAQAVYKISTASANVNLTVEGAAGKVHRYTNEAGKVEDDQLNIYYVDAGTTVTIEITPEPGYYLTKITDTRTTDPHTIDDVTRFTCDYAPAGTATDPTSIVFTVTTAPYLSAKVEFVAAEGLEEALETTYTLTVGGAAYTAETKSLKKDDEVTLTLGDFTDCEVTVMNGTTKIDPDEDDSHVYVVTVGDADLTISVTLKPTLNITFPTQSEGSSEANPAPVQGAWKNLDSSNSDTLAFGPHSVTVNGEAVIEIAEGTNEQDQTVYTLKTESGDKYTLEWFAGVEGYILMLKTAPADPAPAPAGRRNAARAAEDEATYFVSPQYSNKYNAPFAEGDAEKLTGVAWTHTEGEGDTAKTSVITITDVAGKVNVELGSAKAQFVFCVEAGHYLFVIGNDAYEMTLNLDKKGNPMSLTVGDVEFKNPDYVPEPEITEFRNAALLKDGEDLQISFVIVAENYANTDAVKADLTLVIGEGEFTSYQVNTADGLYTVFFHVAPSALHIENDNSADVALKSAAADKTYDKIVAVIGDNHSATFGQDTYTLALDGEGAAQKLVLSFTHSDVVEKKVTSFAASQILKDGENIRVDVLVSTTGYTASELQAATLKLEGATLMSTSQYNVGAQSLLFFDVKNVAIADAAYKLVLVLGTQEYDVAAPDVVAANKSVTDNGKVYTLAITGGVLYLTVAKDEGGQGGGDVGDKSLSNFGAADLIKLGASDFRIVLRFKATGYTEDTLKAEVKIKVGTLECAVNEIVGTLADATVYFLVTSEQVASLENGTYKVTLVADKEYTTGFFTAVSAQNEAKFNAKIYTLSVVERELIVTVAEGEQPTFPNPPTDVTGTDIQNGDEGASLTNNDWRYWNDQGWANSRVEVSVAKMTSDNSIRLWAKCTEGACNFGLQLFYNNTTDYQIGKTYKLTVTIKSVTACTITVNGQQKTLAAGATETFEVEFVYRDANVVENDKVSLFDMQVKVANGEYYDLTLTNIAWSAVAAAEMGDLVEEADTTTKQLINSGKNDSQQQEDGFMLWWVQDTSWGNGDIVTMTPTKENVASAMSNGKITFSYTGGSENYSVQLFYKSTKLQQNTKYFLTLKITLTLCDSLTISVNGQSVTLTSGENNVKVLFEHHYDYDESRQEWDRWKGTYGVDIQFPGTAKLDGVDNVGIEISEVKWYNLKGAEPEVPEEKSLSFSAAKVEKDGDKAYLVLTANSTGYTEADLKSFVIFNNAKEITVNEAKSTFVLNGASTLYFEITSLTSGDSWFWMHLKINGENWNGNSGDLSYNATVNESEYIVCGIYKYYLTLNKGTQLILVIETPNFLEASLQLEGDKVYYVLKVHFEDKDLNAIKKAVLYDNAKEFVADATKTAQFGEEEHVFTLYFDVSTLGEGNFYPHLKFDGTPWNGAEGNGDVNCQAGATATVSTKTMTYTISVTDYNMPMLVVSANPPKFTFDKNGATLGEDPQITLGELVDGVYNVAMPENPFTAPDNKYFRGWQIGSEVYFPGEKFAVAPGDEVTLKAVWEDLFVDAPQLDKSVIGVWGGDVAATGLNIVNGKTTKAVVTYSALGADGDGLTTFAGINVQVIKSANQFYFLRTDVEAALITNNNWGADGDTPSQWRNASGTFEAPTKWGITDYTDNVGTAITVDAWLNAKLNGRTEILMTLADGKLTVTENYYTAKTDGVLYVTFSYVIQNMTEQSYVVYLAAQKGTEVAEATITTYSVLSANQAPTAENPITIGTPDNSVPYTGLSPVWKGTIKKGEKVVLSGTMTSATDATKEGNYMATLAYLYSGFAPVAAIRSDNYIVDGDKIPAAEGITVANSYTIQDGTKHSAASSVPRDSAEWASMRAIIANCNAEITFDYTDASKIVITIVYTGDDNKFTQTYTFTAADGKTLKDEYKIGLGGDHNYTVLTSLVRTSVKSGASSHTDDEASANTTTLSSSSGSVTCEGTYDAANDLVVKLDLGDGKAIYFCQDGLRSELSGELQSGTVGEFPFSLTKEDGYDTVNKEGAKVSVRLSLSGSELTVRYTFTPTGDGMTKSYTATVTVGEGPYTLTIVKGNATWQA